MKNLRWIVFAPAAILAFSAPAQANQYLESFDDGTAELVSVSLGQGAFYCSNYGNAYGTSGPSICMFNTGTATTFLFPQDVAVQGFQFVAGAKNGTSQLTLLYTDGTSEDKPIDGTCCVATVSVTASAGKSIERFSVPADSDLWLFDSLSWWGETSLPPTSTSVETVPPTSTPTQTSSTSTTSTSSTTSSTVPTTMPPPPVDTQPTVETTSPETSLPETTVATTLPAATTTAPTTTVPETTTTVAQTTTTAAPDTTLPSPPQDDSQGEVSLEALAEEPPANAPDEVKEAFEAQVDIFSGDYDTYVPVGSKISVAQRRTVVAVTAVFLMLAPPPSTMRRRQ